MMAALDIRTILLGFVLSSAVSAGVVGSLWVRAGGRAPGSGLWLASFILHFLSVLLIALRGLVPVTVSVLLGNPLLVLGLILLWRGLGRYTGMRTPAIVQVALLAAVAASQGFFTLAQPDLMARNITFSLAGLVISVLSARLLLRQVDRALRAEVRIVALVLIGFAVVSLARIAADAISPPGEDFFGSGLHDAVVLLVFQILLLSLSFGLLLMVNRGLLARLQRDIAERVRAEQSLRESEGRFRALYEDSPVGYQSLDAEGRLLDVNPAWVQMLGYTRDEVIGRYFAELMTPSSRAAFPQRFAAFRERGVAHGAEFELRRRDGEILTAIFDGVFVRDSEGRPAYTHCVLHNITERARSEIELRRLLTAIEQAGEVIFVTDSTGLIEYANPAFERVTGYTTAEALGRNPRLLASGEQPREFYATMWAAITDGRTWHGRLVNRRRDGTLYTEDATISPVRDEAGSIAHYVAVKRDISDQLRLEAQFRQAQKMESVGRLAGGVAHDYNNMLQVILSYASLASATVEPTGKTAAYLREIQKASERSAELTNQLLAFARKQVIAPRALDLAGSVEGMLTMLRRLIGEDIDLAWLPAADTGLVTMDPAQVGQILTNLCVNARDAIATTGRITMATARARLDQEFCMAHPGASPGEYAVLEVGDTGCGMDQGTLDRIFEPFFTTKEEGRGTGLGLATVYGIVKQNDGFIDVESSPGRGATFRIYLPRRAPAPDVVVGEAVRPVPRGHGETVLVVEDEPSILTLTEQLLDSLGYRVLGAATPAQALRVAGLHAGAIDLLLTDVIMPGMNGRDLASRLHASRPGMPCLFMSGYTADVIAHRGVLDDEVQFIAKPFSTGELALRVHALLEQRQPVAHGELRAG